MQGFSVIKKLQLLIVIIIINWIKLTENINMYTFFLIQIQELLID